MIRSKPISRSPLLARYAFRSWSAALVVLCGIVLPTQAGDTWTPTNYQQRFETPKKGIRLKDNNVWVYKRSFAERFGMPERWIDDDLKGAEAVAYRVEWSSLQECGYFGEPDNCRPIERCLLDIYLTDEQSAKLPWKRNYSKNFLPNRSSTRFLSTQNPKDAASWDPDKKQWDISRTNIGLDTLNWVNAPPEDGKVYSASSSAVSVLAYDRKIFEGLDYIKVASDYNFAARKHNVRLFF